MDQATKTSTTHRSHAHLRAVPALAAMNGSAFIDQLVNIDDSQSMIEYVNRFKTEDTVIFVDADELELHAVIDYHKAATNSPGLTEHHAVLSLAHSPEWTLWSAISVRPHEQRPFARILDINSNDIILPAETSLTKTVMDLEMTTIANVLPLLFTLSIPVFTSEPKVDVKAIIGGSQDCNTGKISLGVELVRTSITIQTEIARIASKIALATSVPVIMGSVTFQ